MIVVTIGITLLIIWSIGHYRAYVLEQELATRHPRNASGVMVGAEEIVRAGTNGAAVLLVHGAGDTPQTMGHLADELHDRGYTVVALLLPGHGRTLRNFSRHSGDEWYDAVRVSFKSLTDTHSWVGVVGLSMGGALSARLAADNPDIPALALASPYLAMPKGGELATRASRVWGFFVPYVATASQLSVLDSEARARSLGYGAMTASALRSLRITAQRGWDALAYIHTPTLIVQSRADNRIAASTTLRAFERLGSVEKTMEWIEGSGHVITVDFGWQRVTTLIGNWMDSHRR